MAAAIRATPTGISQAIVPGVHCAATQPAAWEVATLRRRKKRRCLLTIAPASILQKPKRQKLKASSLLTLGALGAAGWELTALSGNTFYLKRPVAAESE